MAAFYAFYFGFNATQQGKNKIKYSKLINEQFRRRNRLFVLPEYPFLRNVNKRAFFSRKRILKLQYIYFVISSVHI